MNLVPGLNVVNNIPTRKHESYRTENTGIHSIWITLSNNFVENCGFLNRAVRFERRKIRHHRVFVQS